MNHCLFKAKDTKGAVGNTVDYSSLTLVRLLPFFILTENNDLATEYEYRHEGVNDYITAPVNIPELIRRVLFFVA